MDLPAEKWQVSRETFNDYALSAGYTILETSASSGRNTNEVFDRFYYFIALYVFLLFLNDTMSLGLCGFGKDGFRE